MPSPLDEPETDSPAPTCDDEVTQAPPLSIEASVEKSPGQTGLKRGAREGDGEEVHTLDVGEGNVVKLDKLGPMIINSDGVSLILSPTRYVTGDP